MSETDAGPKTAKTECGACLCGGVGPVVSEYLKRMGPPEEAKRHFDHARVEFLKGIRALIDARIDSIAPKHETKGTKVTVE
jgi:hypothetical protein